MFVADVQLVSKFKSVVKHEAYDSVHRILAPVSVPSRLVQGTSFPTLHVFKDTLKYYCHKRPRLSSSHVNV
jgi:hypothetical protein